MYRPFLLAVAIAGLFVVASHALEKVNTNDLQFLIVIFRHGYRATAYTYKNDPYGEKVWPGGFSSLTTGGTLQHYKLGKYLAKRYDGYIDKERAIREVYTQSTNYDRTLQSAAANMAGWFPPTKNEVWDKTPLAKAWRPFPVRMSSDPALLGETDCEVIDKRPYRPDLQKIFDAIEKEHKEFLDMVRRNSGESTMTVAKGLEQVSDVLRCQKYAGIRLPAWVTPDVYNKIQYLDNLRFHIWVGGNGDVERTRVNGGKLFKYFMDLFANKTKNAKDLQKRKAYVFASHDNSVGGLLSVLDLYDYGLTNIEKNMAIPLYANTLMFELYKDNTVRILHKNDTTENNFENTDPIVLKHAKCDVRCPLTKLVELTKDYLPTTQEWETECEDKSRRRFPVKRPVRIPQ
ncbi:prostatic acid phosphatase-like [Paramacrobiotus metropolitanus]|uniref:prostatic acid phosphatase-like n=1 Tax=Paramacrobiotus metropolitanus TaxID=2943436 RepID=UPI002445653F|nr:prostatic acid phosphatase-like [Paramacrobiotus metropolitanus]